jgi:predicted ATPase/DNA-binding SARP family transcriptional activator
VPTLSIRCFGTFRVESNGEAIASFETDKARALLAYLAVEADRPHHRDRLAGLLWSDQTEERALHNLRQTLTCLRRALHEDTAPIPNLLINRDTVQLNPDSHYWLDVKAFREALDAAHCHNGRRHGLGHVDIRRLKQALTLPQGPFLDQFFLNGSPLFDEWVSLQREEYNRREVEALALLAEYHERRGEYRLAQQTAARLTHLTPWDETAHKQLMRLLAMDRQWSAAQNQYVILRRHLGEQLGVEPTRETVALFESIRQAAATESIIPPRFPLARHNLPTMPTPFVGREAELETISEKIADPDCRLLTLLGPGGIGKTRLALEAAHEQLGIFPDGVFFVPLVSTSASDLLPSTIAEAMQFSFSERSDWPTQLLDYLRHKHLLLLLDNFEHLLAAAGSTGLLSEILRQAPNIMLLVASRERLNLQEECVYSLEGMSYPLTADSPPETLETFDALSLFVRCARQMQRNFSLDATNRTAVLRICQLLDGLPLGLELAAAATWARPCPEIAERLARDFTLLTATASNVPARHRSLRAAFDVSWQLLTAAEQAAFCQLSVFHGGFKAFAAEQVTGASPALLSALLDKSLLRRNSTGRYDLHEAIRQYAADQLAETPNQATATQTQHARYYASVLAGQTADLKSPRQTAALEAIHQEIENARYAWGWLAQNGGAIEISQCAESLYQYFNIRSRFAEGVALFQQAAQGLPPTQQNELTLGMVLSRLGALAFRAREHELAQAALEHSREVFMRLGAQAELAFCLIPLGGLQLRKKAPAAALACAQDSLALYRQLGDAWGQTYALYLLGLIKNRLGDFQAARIPLEAAVALCRQTGNQHRLITLLNLLGDLACSEGDYASAGPLFRESLEICRALNDRFNQAILLNNLATVYQACQEYAQERAVFEESLAICREIGDRDGEAMALNGLGEMAAYLGHYQEAVTFSQQALAIACQVEEAWTLIACHNNLGEAFCGLGQTRPATEHLRTALKLATESEATDLVVGVAVNLGRLYQTQGQVGQAAALLQAALAHSAIENEARTKAQRWLAEMGVETTLEADDTALDKALQPVIVPQP